MPLEGRALVDILKICIHVFGMRIGERGQVTIPKKLREKYGLEPHDEVAFLERRGELILQKSTVPQEDSRFRRWIGYLGRTGTSVDEFIEDIRGR